MHYCIYNIFTRGVEGVATMPPNSFETCSMGGFKRANGTTTPKMSTEFDTANVAIVIGAPVTLSR